MTNIPGATRRDNSPDMFLTRPREFILKVNFTNVRIILQFILFRLAAGVYLITF